MEASFYQKENDKIRCVLCPHHCLLKNGQAGICRVRRNLDGILQAETYGRLSAIHLDPIEKKPLYHFFPGSHILSIGSVGCNLHCSFCQNCEISQVSVHEYSWIQECTVEQIAEKAKLINGNIGIAFTYNEPVVFYEFMIDVAKATHNMGLKNVMVTNGYIEPEPLENLIPFMDAFNVDLKAFTETFYWNQTHSHIEPVKQTLLDLHKAHKHVEVTNLIIPGLNDNMDDFKAMIGWIVDNLGKQTILHLSKYFPKYHMTKSATPDPLLLSLYAIAKQQLDYVYIGNVGNHVPGHDTVCANCQAIAIKRDGYQVDSAGITRDGNCIKCDYPIVING
jgi:pyruvate formate lyase activating enzyme